MARDEFIRIRVTPEEKARIQKKADKANRSLSDFVRAAALGKEVVALDGIGELAKELRYQGNNFNQLTMLARMGRVSMVNLEPYTEVKAKVWQALNSLLSRAV